MLRPSSLSGNVLECGKLHSILKIYVLLRRYLIKIFKSLVFLYVA